MYNNFHEHLGSSKRVPTIGSKEILLNPNQLGILVIIFRESAMRDWQLWKCDVMGIISRINVTYTLPDNFFL